MEMFPLSGTFFPAFHWIVSSMPKEAKSSLPCFCSRREGFAVQVVAWTHLSYRLFKHHCSYGSLVERA